MEPKMKASAISDGQTCRNRIEQAYAQPRLFEDAKVGAGDTATTPSAQAHYPEEWGPSDNRRLTCVCGDSDPFHATKTPNTAVSGD